MFIYVYFGTLTTNLVFMLFISSKSYLCLFLIFTIWLSDLQVHHIFIQSRIMPRTKVIFMINILVGYAPLQNEWFRFIFSIIYVSVMSFGLRFRGGVGDAVRQCTANRPTRTDLRRSHRVHAERSSLPSKAAEVRPRRGALRSGGTQIKK